MKIDTWLAPTPSSFKIDIEDIVEASRTESATMFIEFIATKRKLFCKWNYLNRAEASELMAKVRPQFVTVEYDDMETGAIRIATFYTGSKSGEVSKIMSDYTAQGYTSVTFNFIEQ